MRVKFQFNVFLADIINNLLLVNPFPLMSRSCVNFRLEMKKEFPIPAEVNSASYNAELGVFVCGGEDFKMYKFDYNTGTELGM